MFIFGIKCKVMPKEATKTSKMTSIYIIEV